MTTHESGTTAEELQALLSKARIAAASEPETGVALADQCVARATEEGDLHTAAAAWRIHGQALRALGRHADAVSSFEAAAAAARAAGEPLLAAQVRLGEIDSLAMLGRADAATALAESLVRDLHALGAPTDAAKALCNLGSVHLRADRYTEALDCYERADAVFVASDSDPLMHALAQVNRAIALTYLGGAEEAIALYNEAGETYHSRGHTFESAVVESNVGVLHHASGRYAAAIASFNRAYATFEEQGRPLEVARCDVDRGDSYRTLNLLPEALECYARSLAIFEGDLPLDYDRGRAEIGSAAILLAQGRGADGLAALERAELVFRRQRNAPQRAHVRLIRATALWDAGSGEECATLARRAARTFAAHRLRGWAAEARFLIAAVDLTADTPTPKAVRAMRRMASVSRVARAEGLGWLECRAEHARGRFHAAAGRSAQALRHLRNAAAALESARTLIAPEEMHTAFLRDKQTVYEDLCALLLERGRPADLAEAMNWVERSRSRLLLDRIAAAGAQPGSLPSALATRLEALRAELSRAYRAMGALGDTPQGGDAQRRFVGTSPTPLPEIERAYENALREAELEIGTGATLTQSTIPLSDLQKALAPGEALLSFFGTRGTFTAFLVDRQGLHAVPQIARVADVEQAVRRLRYHLHKVHMGAAELPGLPLPSLRGEMDGVLQRLYSLLLGPVERYLAGKERVIVVPHGRLHELPFHAFFDGTHYATDRWEFAYAPSATIWHHVRTRRRSRNAAFPGEDALLVGVPSPGIEQVGVEIKRLATLLPGTRTLVGPEATLDAVTRGVRSAKVLHLATHAHFRQDNPYFSGFQLADGWLLTRDIYALRPFACEMVTLSACETGVSRAGPGDELVGLVRGFLAAGARTVLGALWPADDASTADLMTAFYRAWCEGLSVGASLRQAQQSVRRDYPHAYYWAAFSLFGDSGNTSELSSIP